MPVKSTYHPFPQAMPMSFARNTHSLGPSVSLLVPAIIKFDTPQRYFAVALTLILAAAMAFSSHSDDLLRATQRLLIGTIYANI